MDAQVMKMTHELLGSMVQKMDNTEISDDEFVAAIVGIQNDMVINAHVMLTNFK